MVTETNNDFIEMFDNRGKKILIKKDEYVKNVLKYNLELMWDEPDKLYGFILSGLDDGFSQHLVDATKHLVELDTWSERSSCLLAIVQMKNKNNDGAKHTLLSYIEKKGEAAYILTNLSKVYYNLGDEEKGFETLRRSLKIDPNQENALQMWVSIHKEKEGSDAVYTALDEIAKEEGAWRPQLNIAIYNLMNNKSADVITAIKEALSKAPVIEQPLFMVSGELGKADLVNEIIEVVEPLYIPEKHGLWTGMNLIRANIRVGNYDHASILIRSIRKSNNPPVPHFEEALLELEKELLDTRHKHIKEIPQMGFLLIEGPLWKQWLKNSGWLIPSKVDNHIVIHIYPFADQTRSSGNENLQVHGEDDSGRFIRGLSLFINESIVFRTNASSTSHFIVTQDFSPVVFVKPTNVEHYLNNISGIESPDFIISGSVVNKTFGDYFELLLWNVAKKKQVGKQNIKLIKKYKGAATDIWNAVQRILENNSMVKTVTPPSHYIIPEKSLDIHYINSLAQLLTQVNNARSNSGSYSLWNERGMFEHHWDLMEAVGGSNSILIAMTAVIAGKKYDSPHFDLYRDLLIKIIDKEDNSSIGKKVSPAFFKKLGMQDEYLKSYEEHINDPDIRYVKWLKELEVSDA